MALVLSGMFLTGCATEPERPSVKQLFKKSLEESRVLKKGPATRAVDKYATRNRKPEATLYQQFINSIFSMPDWITDMSRLHKWTERALKSDEKPQVPGRETLSGPTISSTFTQTDVRQAIQVIANQAKTTVIIDQQVQGLVSAVINDEPFEAGLQRLLLPLGLVYRKVGSRYYVGVSSPSSSLFSKIAVQHIYRTKNLGPKKLYELLPERQKQFVRVSKQQQALLIEAPKRITHEIRLRLKKMDQPVKQVVIEAIVAVFAPDSRFRFGLDFSQGIRVRDDEFINVMLEDLELTGQYGSPQFNAVRNFSFTSTFLQALAEEGYLTIRASPRVMARDGQEAKIRIGRQTFFSTTPNIDSDARFFDQEIRDVESGIVLNMVPTIRGNDVIINLKNAEVSEEIRTTQSATAINNNFPVINRREVSTTVGVEDGMTIVIGGLVQKTVINQRANIPLISRIPLLGKAFHEVDKQTQQREVAVFLSPRIVTR